MYCANTKKNVKKTNSEEIANPHSKAYDIKFNNFNIHIL